MRIETISQDINKRKSMNIHNIGFSDFYNNSSAINAPGDINKLSWSSFKTALTNITNKVVSTGKTISLAPFRVAFLGLVSINVHKIANFLQKMIIKDSARIKSFWEKWGGNYSQLVTTVTTGSKRSPIFKNNTPDTETINSISVAAAIAAATPVIVAVIGLYKELFPNDKDIDKLDQATEDTNNNNQDPTYNNVPGAKPGETVAETVARLQREAAAAAGETTKGGNAAMWLGGAALAYLIVKK